MSINTLHKGDDDDDDDDDDNNNNLLLLLLLVVTFMQVVYKYIPETNHVYGVHNFAAIVWLRFYSDTSHPLGSCLVHVQ